MNTLGSDSVKCLLLALLTAIHFPVLADEPPPLVHLLATDPIAAEEALDPGAFTVVRYGSLEDSLTVLYQIGGTALNGVDYETLSGSVTIPAQSAHARIRVQPFEDRLMEGHETVVIALRQPAVWPPPYLACWPSVGVVTIQDNDSDQNQPPFVKLVSPPEGAVFVGPVDITLAARAWDLDGRVHSVEFFADGTSLGKVINRPRVWDPVLLGEASLDLNQEDWPALYPDLQLDVDTALSPERFPANLYRLVWSNAPAGPHQLSAVATDHFGAETRSEPVGILVLEPPRQPIVEIVAPDPVAEEPSASADRLNTALFRVYRHGGDPSVPLHVYYRIGGTASNGEDYSEIPHLVTIPEHHRFADIVIEPLHDDLVEGAESIVLTLVPPLCIDIYPPPLDCYRVGRYDRARAILLDNDTEPNVPPVVRIVRPQDGDIFLAPADIRLVAEAFDLDGTVVQVEFFEGHNSLGVVTRRNSFSEADLTRPIEPVFALTWSNVPPGRYILTAEATDNAGGSTVSRPVEIKVVEIHRPPVVTIEAVDATAAEGGLVVEPNAIPLPDPARFRVTRTGATDRALEVFYHVGGSASNGVDYVELSGQLTIPEGASFADIRVLPLDDNRCEGTESVVITVRPIPCIALWPPPAQCYAVGDPDQARAVIRDNDLCPDNQPPKVVLVLPEDGSVFKAPADIPIVAQARDADGFVQSVSFYAGDTLLGTVMSDSNDQEWFRFLWSNVQPGAYILTAHAVDNEGARASSEPVRIKVLDETILPLVWIEATDPRASEAPIQIGPGELPWPDTRLLGDTASGPILLDTATFTVHRRGATSLPLSVYYEMGGTAENGEDYETLSGVAYFPADALTASIEIVPIDDELVEGTETIVASLVPFDCDRTLSPLPTCYRITEPHRAVAYLRDDEVDNQKPHVEITRPEQEQSFPSNQDIKIEALAVDPDGWVGLVEFYDGDKKIGEDSIVFIQPPPPGQEQMFQFVWSGAEPGRHVLTAKATDNQGAMSISDPVFITVEGPCLLPVVTARAVDRVATEQDPRLDILSDLALFQICRSCDLDRDLVVYYEVSGTADNGEDYETLSGEVIIPAGSRCADIIVAPIDDNIPEGTETVVLKLVPVDCHGVDPAAGGCYLVGDPAGDTVLIHDNDNIPPRVALVRPEPGQAFTAPASIRLTAEASDPDGWVTQIEFLSGDDVIGGLAILVAEPPEPGQTQVFHFTWADVPAGRYVLSARVTDNLGAKTRSDPVPIAVLETPDRPVVTIESVDGLAREGTTNNAAFRVRRTGSTDQPLTVHYRIGGTSENGVDYKQLEPYVTIPAGRLSARIEIIAAADDLDEGIETVVLRLTLPPAATETPPYVIGYPAAAAAIILDPDEPRPYCRRLPDNLFHVCIKAFDGQGYRLEASDNLKEWTVLCESVVQDGAIHFVDPEAEGMRARFYRAMPAAVSLDEP